MTGREHEFAGKDRPRTEAYLCRLVATSYGSDASTGEDFVCLVLAVGTGDGGWDTATFALGVDDARKLEYALRRTTARAAEIRAREETCN